MTSDAGVGDGGADGTSAGRSLDQVRVRLTRDDDLPALEALFLEAFEGAWPPFAIDCSVQEHIAWKMNADPQSRAEQIVATPVDDDQDVICAALRIRRPGWMQGRDRVLMDAADMSVHPDWRQIRLSRYLRAARVELGQVDDFDVLLQWLPHHPATRQQFIDHSTLGNRVLVLWRPGSLRTLISVPLKTAGWGQLRRVLGEAFRRRLRRPRFQRFEGHLVDLEEFDDDTDAVWEAAKSQFDFAVRRTQDYLNWRYVDPRAGRFEVRAAVDGDPGGGEVVGYSVTKLDSDPAEVVDLLVRPGRVDALAALLLDAVARIRERGDADIHLWLPTVHPYMETVRNLGFLDSGRDPSLRYEPAVMTAEDLAFLADPTLAAHVTQGDSDFT